jgi:hypothetical protein
MSRRDAAADALVVEAAVRTIQAARRVVESYAGPFAPVRTDQLSELLAAYACHVEIFPFQSETVAMTLPRCAGVYPILVNRLADRVDRLFAFRHELAHVINGDCEGAVYLSEEGFAAHVERVADLFALADVVPGWWIDSLRRGRAPWRGVRAEVGGAVGEFAGTWPETRRLDRVALRLKLYRERGI